MSPQSMAVVQSHPDFEAAHIAGNVFTLFKIVKDTHMINMEGEQLRFEQKLREMSMGSEDYTTYASRFHDLLVGLGSAGSKISATRQVYVFLMSLRGSPLQISADRWLENPHQDGYPASFDEARNLMHLAWMSKAESLQRDLAMVARLPSHPAYSQQSVQSSSTGSRCLFCRGSHPTDSCRLYRVEHRDGQILVVPFSSEKKKSRKGGPKKNTSGLVIHGEFAKSSYFVGTASSRTSSSRLVLDTGTTVHIFRDRDLLSSTSSCREEVHGVVIDCRLSSTTLVGSLPPMRWALPLFWSRITSRLNRGRGPKWSESSMSVSTMQVMTRWHHCLIQPVSLTLLCRPKMFASVRASMARATLALRESS
jgi:hypothetical protein